VSVLVIVPSKSKSARSILDPRGFRPSARLR
jgi:hypothetical protein